MASNTSITRVQEPNSSSSSDQPSNPFDVKIRRPKFPGKIEDEN
jgi:hypothetical protein